LMFTNTTKTVTNPLPAGPGVQRGGR
jgi:hypothetical protein